MARAAADPFALQVGPVPGWVKPITPPAKTTLDAQGSGIVYLLVDSQDNLDLAAFYYHEVFQVTSENGAQSNGSVSASFNPRFERLTFHYVRVLRGGAASNRLDRAHSSISTREKNADRTAYNPTLKVEVLLDDVRPGDIVEYAYTKEGSNPLARGKYAWIYPTQWASPIEINRLRLLVSANRSLGIKTLNGAPEPRVTTAKGVTEISYETNAIPGRPIDDDVPYDYAPRQGLEVSEFRSWAELAHWAAPVFSWPEPKAPEFLEELRKLRAITGEEQQVIAALQFVQDEIRSVNLSSYAGDHPITSPDTLMQRRFGDYADKVALLVALLRGCGHDAAPALVSDNFRANIQQHLPSPALFDHAIVEVRLASGVHWIDPWREAQRGPLSQIFVGRFGYALVLRPETTDLTAMAPPEDSWPVKKVVERYRIPRPDNAGELEVISDYYGAAADKIRGSFRERTREEVQKSYLEFYTRNFPEATPQKLLWYEELPGRNGCRVTEWYNLPHVWQLDEARDRYVLNVNPGEISTALGSALSLQRADPFRHDYPDTVTQETEIEMFQDWSLEVKPRTITNSFFEIQDQPSLTGPHMRLAYAYRSLRDRVEVSELAKYNEEVDRAKSSLGYSLTYQTPEQLKKAQKPSTFNWAVAAAGICALSLASLIAFYSIRYGRLPSPKPPLLEEKSNLDGINGWLILLAIIQLLRPFSYLRALYLLAPKVFTTGAWRSLTDPIEATYNPWGAPSLLFALLYYIFSLVFCCLLLVLFFRKRAAWPRWFIAFALGNILGASIDYFLTRQIPEAAPSPYLFAVTLAFACPGAAIWVAYVLRSKRVRATFRY